MDTRSYKLDLTLTLVPVFDVLPPKVVARLDDHVLWSGSLESKKSLTFLDSLPAGKHGLEIDLYDKPDSESSQAVRVSELSLCGITSPRFIWQGRYRPCYPEPWATEQRHQGQVLLDELSNTDYLGWNGTWRLEFTLPVFTWIHQVEGLGWIYD